MEDIARKTYNKELKPGQLDEAYILENYRQTDPIKRPITQDPTPLQLKMAQNIFKFSMAKNYTMLKEVNELMKDSPNWETFKGNVLKLNPKYNVNYLQAEYQTAVTASQRALDWEAFQANKSKYPNLKYYTQEDERVRREHEKLHGTVAPIDSDFWRRYYPPNGWRCRCYVRQTTEPATKALPIPSKGEVKPEFELNVGISGEIFKQHGGKIHPYFALAKTEANKELFELHKNSAPLIAYQTPNGKTVYINPFTDIKDFNGNMKGAIMAAEHLNMELTLAPNIAIDKRKNPEYIYNGFKGDRISPKRGGNITNQLNNAFKRKLTKDGQLYDEPKTFLMLEMWFDVNDKNLEAFARQCNAKLQFYKTVKFVVLYSAKNALKIDRNHDFNTIMQNLHMTFK